MLDGLMNLWNGLPMAQEPNLPIGQLSNFAFLQLINDFLRSEVDIYTWKLLTRFGLLAGTVAATLVILWVFIQGFRIITGQSRDSMMALVVQGLRATLIVMLATSMASGGSQLYWTLTDGMGEAITGMVTGKKDDPYKSIDQNLAVMTLAMGAIDALEVESSDTAKQAKDRAAWFTGIGIAGPAIVAGAMLLLNKIAMALFIGFGPMFILCLLFEQTKQLFTKWLYYGIATMFSLALLVVMVEFATKVIGAVAVAFLTKYVASGFQLNGEGINSMAMQQGGLGLLMTTLLITAPPMAASFFNGMLGQFTAYSMFGQVGRQTGGDAQPGSPNYNPYSNYSNNQAAMNRQGGASREGGQGFDNAPNPGSQIGYQTQSVPQQRDVIKGKPSSDGFA